jgi:hypothetical protein
LKQSRCLQKQLHGRITTNSTIAKAYYIIYTPGFEEGTGRGLASYKFLPCRPSYLSINLLLFSSFLYNQKLFFLAVAFGN